MSVGDKEALGHPHAHSARGDGRHARRTAAVPGRHRAVPPRARAPLGDARRWSAWPASCCSPRFVRTARCARRVRRGRAAAGGGGRGRDGRPGAPGPAQRGLSRAGSGSVGGQSAALRAGSGGCRPTERARAVPGGQASVASGRASGAKLRPLSDFEARIVLPGAVLGHGDPQDLVGPPRIRRQPAAQCSAAVPRRPAPLPETLGDSFSVGAARAAGVSDARLRGRDLERPFSGVRSRRMPDPGPAERDEFPAAGEAGARRNRILSASSRLPIDHAGRRVLQSCDCRSRVGRSRAPARTPRLPRLGGRAGGRGCRLGERT